MRRTSSIHYTEADAIEIGFEEVVPIYELAADSGHNFARAEREKHLKAGLGVKKNTAEAVALFKLSADTVNIQGQIQLGLCIRDGV